MILIFIIEKLCDMLSLLHMILYHSHRESKIVNFFFLPSMLLKLRNKIRNMSKRQPHKRAPDWNRRKHVVVVKHV